MIFFTLNRRSIAGVGLSTLLENFVKVINKNEHSPFLRENYKNILDVAHSTNPAIAKTLVNTIDNDPARRNTGAYLNNHYNLLEFQSKLEKKITSNDSQQNLLESNPKFFLKIMEKKLAHLNASKIIDDTLLPKDLVYQLKMASQYSIYESYNVFAYFIERLVLMYEDTDEAKKLIRNSFSELLEVCGLIKLLSIRNADKIKSLLDVLSLGDKENESLHSQFIDEETKSIVLNLLSKGKTIQEISNFLPIDIELIQELEIKL